MRGRVVWVLVFAVAGCESVRPAVVDPPPRPTSLQGGGDAGVGPQAASREACPEPLGKPLAASSVEVPRASSPEPVRLTRPQDDDPLALMAKCLERDDIRGAALHLDAYVREHPDQPLFRLRLAELYARADQPAEAKFHYERFTLDAQDGPPALQPHRVTAHIKLMEIAQARNDRFGELFHRGVGLLLLVQQMDGLKDGRRGARGEPAGGSPPQADEGFCEETLCKSLNALMEAKELKPTDPRVRAYLAEAHARAGNAPGARAERTGAREGVTAGELTPRERGGLAE